MYRQQWTKALNRKYYSEFGGNLTSLLWVKPGQPFIRRANTQRPTLTHSHIHLESPVHLHMNILNSSSYKYDKNIIDETQYTLKDLNTTKNTTKQHKHVTLHCI